MRRDLLYYEHETDGQLGLRKVRQALLRAYDEDPCALSDEALNEWLLATARRLRVPLQKLPRASTFRAWRRERGSEGDRRLADMGRRQEKSAQATRLAPPLEDIIKEEGARYYERPGVNAKDIYSLVRHRVTDLNMQRQKGGLPTMVPPSEVTIWRRLKAGMTYENAERRMGSRRAKLLLTPHDSYAPPSHLLEVVIIDDTVVDCMVIDETQRLETGEPIVIGRPHLIYALDSFSRCVTAFMIDFKDPGVETAMGCLRQIAKKKDDLKDHYPDLRGHFPWSGVPETVMYDRAWGNVGSSTQDALEDVGVSLMLAPAGTPEFKGRCERFFGTLNSRLFHKLPGAVPFKPHKNKEYGLDPVSDARLTLPELHRLVAQAIIDYNNDFHRGLNDIPARVWNERASSQGVRSIEGAELDAFNMACAKLARPLILSSKGIELHGLKYCSPQVGDLLADLLPSAPKRGRRECTLQVKVKYFPEDLSTVFVWNKVKREYVALLCVEKRYTTNLTEFQHTKIKEFQEERALQWRSEDDRCRARALLFIEATARLRDKKLGNRKRMVKLLGNAVNVATLAGSNSALERPEVRIPCSAVHNRASGDFPERKSVRKRRNKGWSSNEVPTISPQFNKSGSAAPTEVVGTVGADFFSDNRESLLEGFSNGEPHEY